MKIDFNQSMSMVKRMIKLADKNILDQQLVRKQLHSIAEYAKEESLLKAATAMQKCLQKINKRLYSKTIIDDLKKLMVLLKKEKFQVIAEHQANLWLYTITNQ